MKYLFFFLFLLPSLFAQTVPDTAKLKLAVIGSKSEMKNKIESKLESSGFVDLANRTQQTKVLKEFQTDKGIPNESDYEKVGKLLGVSYLVVIDANNKELSKLVHVKSARILYSWTNFSEKEMGELLNILENEASILEILSLQRKKTKEFRLEIMNIKGLKEDGGAKFGEEITFEFKVISKIFKEVFVTILTFTSDGSYIQLFPNKYQSNHKIPTNKEYIFPSLSNAIKKYRIVASPPAGEDTVIILASELPLQLPDNDDSIYVGQYKVLTQKKLESTKGIALQLSKVKEVKYDLEKVILSIREK